MRACQASSGTRGPAAPRNSSKAPRAQRRPTARASEGTKWRSSQLGHTPFAHSYSWA
jgi:hypothetical protein